MFQAFNLELKLEDLSDDQRNYTEGKRIAEEHRQAVKDILGAGVVDGAKVQSEWFPQVKADIFLSHSHRDEHLALCLAGWLKEKYSLNCFVDSAVWGYADKLLWEIDAECCPNGDGTFNYHQRNGTTGHVHMMLATALGKMIDSTECLMFLNTPNSLKPSLAVLGEEGQPRTFSPWIYFEISMLNLIERKKPSRVTNFSEGKRAGFPAVYPLDLSRLVDLPADLLLHSWQSTQQRGGALDDLYAIVDAFQRRRLAGR